MDVFSAILGRRSVRQFKPEPVAAADLDKILEAARWAPSWANTQCAEYVVVSDPAVKAALAEAVNERNPGRAAILEAPLVIAGIGRQGAAGFKKGLAVTVLGDWSMFDVALGLANLTLAAHALGYGTVHVGMLDHVQAGAALGLPENYRLFELVPLGRPASAPQAPPRKALAEIVHRDKF